MALTTPTISFAKSIIIALLALLLAACESNDNPNPSPNPNPNPNPATGAEEKTDRFFVPDENFRNKLKELIPNAFDDDMLIIKSSEVTERTSFTELFGASIKDLTGIEYFVNLTILHCGNNELTSLDVSQNAKLTNLTCSDNLLTTLDVSQNTELNDLKCPNNQLTRLAIPPGLINLSCAQNQLTSLALPENSFLRTLTCQDNQLTSLDVSKSTRFLQSLDCSSNQLTLLNLSQNTSLRQLNCKGNIKMKELDMTGIRSTLPSGLIINADNVPNPNPDDFNPYEILRVHDNLKDRNEIKRIKFYREDNVVIKTYSAAAGSVDYKEECGDYTPPTASDSGGCATS